jgi:integrase/recombinase XerD
MSDLPVLHGDVVSQEQALIPVIPDTVPLDQNPAAVLIAAQPSINTKRSKQQALDKIAYYLQHGQFPTDTDETKGLCFSMDWSRLEYQHTAAIRAALMNQYKPGSVNVMLAALRGVIKECANLGYISPDTERAAIKVKNVKGETVPAGRDLKSGEIAALFRVCNGDIDRKTKLLTNAGVKDAAIIAVLYIGGLRRSEVVGLDVSDYDAESGKITIRLGKGRKERTVYAGEAGPYLDLWLERRGTETDQAAALFLPVNKGDKIEYSQKQQKVDTYLPARLTSQSVYNMLLKRGEEAKIEDFSPHDFRRTMVGDMLEAGVDLAQVQKIAGHASPITTARYDRRPEEGKRVAASKLHIPRPGAMF